MYFSHTIISFTVFWATLFLARSHLRLLSKNPPGCSECLLQCFSICHFVHFLNMPSAVGLTFCQRVFCKNILCYCKNIFSQIKPIYTLYIYINSPPFQFFPKSLCSLDEKTRVPLYNMKMEYPKVRRDESFVEELHGVKVSRSNTTFFAFSILCY